MSRNLWRLGWSACLLIIAGTCLADSFSEGFALYKAGKYQEAVVKLEQATHEEPNNAKAWWQLNFAYNKLNRYADALRAVRKAGELDPTHGFASAPGKYEEVLSRLERKVLGATSSPRAFGTRRSSTSTLGSVIGNNITRQLLDQGVYVAPGMNVDVNHLRSVARELGSPPVKFVVLNSSAEPNALAAEADRIRRALNLEDGIVIIGGRQGVAAASKSLDQRALEAAVQQAAPQIAAGNYTAGLDSLARNLVRAQQMRQQQSRKMWIAILLLAGGVVIAWIIVRQIAMARTLATHRERLERLKSDVISQMNYLEDSASHLDEERAAQVREARIAAGTKLDEAARLMATSRSIHDLRRAQTLLDQAQAELMRGRAIADGREETLTAATLAPRVETSARIDWSQVPEDERGVCFFCSRPELLINLTPVTVNLDDRPQKVLACRDDLETIKTGQMPMIRAFNVDGRYVPWYADSRYDPYRDYYDRGYDNRSLLSDMIAFSMIDRMFWVWHRPAWGGGWDNTYVFYPDHETYCDYYSKHAAAADYDRPSNAAGAGFLQDVGGDDSVGAGVLGGDQS